MREKKLTFEGNDTYGLITVPKDKSVEGGRFIH